MFFLYESNDLSIIVQTICNIIKKNPLSNPLEQETILVDNIEIKRWLKYSISKKLGITANIKILNISTYIKQLYKSIMLKTQSSVEINEKKLTWYLMNLDKKKIFFSFLKNCRNSFEKYLFFSNISNLLRKYIKYKPHWINAWNQGRFFFEKKEKQKQEKFWIKILKYIKEKKINCSFYPTLLLKFSSFIESRKIVKNCFPYRIFLIGTLQCSRYEILFLIKSSVFSTFHFMLMCSNESNNIVINNKTKQQRNKNVYSYVHKCLKQEKHLSNIINSNKKSLHYNNLLLQSWGEIELEYKIIFRLFVNKITNLFRKKCLKKNVITLLNSIKKNIFLDDNNSCFSRISNKKKKFCKTKNFDDSVSIHVCHSIQIEVQVLHDNLLYILNNNTDIFPEHIIVKVENIESYIPFIKNVFNNVEKKNFIPFTIIQQDDGFNKTIFDIFLKLLNISNLSFFHQEIFSILEIPCIYKKFLLTKQDVFDLFKWTNESYIRWALDDKQLKNMNLPSNIKNTWKEGIRRIIVSYSIGRNNKKIWNNIFQSHISEIQISDILNKFLTFFSCLEKWKKKLSTLKKPKHWSLIGQEIIQDFFKKDKDEETTLNWIIVIWNEIISLSKSMINKKIGTDILIQEIKNRFLNMKRKKKFFSGTVTISNTRSFEYIPFKVTYFIGLNEKSRLKSKSYNFFDLISLHKKNENKEIFLDKYSFLMSLINTKNKFYISYIKKNGFVNDENYPSSIVQELLYYIENYVYVETKSNLVKKKFFLPIYHSSCLWNKKRFQENSKYQTFDKEWLKIAKNYYFQKIEKKNKEKIKISLHKKTFCIKDFIFFWKSPIHYFFRVLCNVSIKVNYNDTLKFEPFSIKNLDKYKLKKKLLIYTLKNKNVNSIFNEYKASGRLPYQYFGKHYFQQQKKEIDYLVKRIFSISLNPFKKLLFKIKIKNNFLIGTMNVLKESPSKQFGVFYFKPTVLNMIDGMDLWIQHLVYCSIGGKKPSIMLGLKNSEWKIYPITKKKSRYYLKNYISGFITGSSKPILLTNSGIHWLNSMFDKKSKSISTDSDVIKKSKKKFFKYWIGNQFKSGEKEHTYIKKVISNLKQKDVDEMFKSAIEWFYPILKNSFERKNIL